MSESFSEEQVITAIKQFLQYGEDGYRSSMIVSPPGGNCHLGYYSGNGFAARALRYHLQQLEPQLPDEGSAAVMCDRCGVRPKTRSTQAGGDNNNH